ncbi:hypothetical protein [Ferruginibacter sp.]|nr:hypothetical protein [Ferruginibacter sp.]
MMLYKLSTVMGIVFVVLVSSCSKKHVPQTASKPVILYNGKEVVATPAVPTTPAVKKTAVRKVVAPVAKVIIVNDKAAKKNIDGRLYYDVEGRRYWRNYDDGKYYLFNKSMYSDSAFKPH